MTTAQDTARTVSTQDLRDNLADHVRDAQYGTPAGITRNGKLVARLVSSDAIVLAPSQLADLRAAYKKATTTGVSGVPRVIGDVLAELGRLLDTDVSHEPQED